MRCPKNMSKKGSVLRPPGEPKVDFVLFFGTPFGPKRGPKSPKADLKTMKKTVGFDCVFGLGGVQEAAKEESKNGSKNRGGR